MIDLSGLLRDARESLQRLIIWSATPVGARSDDAAARRRYWRRRPWVERFRAARYIEHMLRRLDEIGRP